jgi:hypothetical protein
MAFVGSLILLHATTWVSVLEYLTILNVIIVDICIAYVNFLYAKQSTCSAHDFATTF